MHLLRLFLFHLKRLIFIELDKIQLDFYIYQLFNNHTERLLDTVVPLNLFSVKTLVIRWLWVNQCLLHFSMIINVILSISTSANNQAQHQYIDIYTQTSSPLSKKQKDLPRTQDIILFIQRVHHYYIQQPIFIIKLQCENIINSNKFVAIVPISSKTSYFH